MYVFYASFFPLNQVSEDFLSEFETGFRTTYFVREQNMERNHLSNQNVFLPIASGL